MGQHAYSPARKAPRFAPKQPVTVAISQGGVPTDYGIVSNLSEGGACLQTRTVPRYRDVEMMLSFYEGAYLQANGRVVWTAPGDGIATVGIEFTGMSPRALASLQESLSRLEFEPV